MKPQNYNILIQRDSDGFVAYCPELSLSSAKQPTEELAREVLKEGIAMLMAVPEPGNPEETHGSGERINRNTRASKEPSGRKLAKKSKKPNWIM